MLDEFRRVKEVVESMWPLDSVEEAMEAEALRKAKACEEAEAPGGSGGQKMGGGGAS